MGGRGGGSSLASKASPVVVSQEQEEFRQWLANAFPITADQIDDPQVPNKVMLVLPDRNGIIERLSPGKSVIRDAQTDEILFTGKSDPDLYRKVSAFYHAPVEFTPISGRGKRFGEQRNRHTSPAAQKYGVD